jgi:thimet oligopeptidase
MTKTAPPPTTETTDTGAGEFSIPPAAAKGGPSTSASPAKPVSPEARRLLDECAKELAAAKAALTALLAPSTPRTIEGTLSPFNALLIHLDNAEGPAGLLSNVHPDVQVREAAERCERDVASFYTELSLNRPLYEVFAQVAKALGLPAKPGAAAAVKEDPSSGRWVEHTLRDFRRSGVDKDEATRAKIRALQDEIVAIGQTFERNIREDVRAVTLDGPAALKGLPKDYIDGHNPDASGKIRITTDYPDYIPFITYADDGAARLALYKQFRQRGWPENLKVLGELLSKRHELATLLGYKSWAEYITEDKMIKTAPAVQTFIDQIAKSASKRAKAEVADLLARKRRDDPKANTVGDDEKAYYEEKIKSERYHFNAQDVRPYFEYGRVRDGLLALTSELYELTFARNTTVSLWHGDVEAYDVSRGGKLVGRIYLDMHPRDGKYKHAAQFSLKKGAADERLPEGVLVCNLPKPAAGGAPALLEHDEVVTMFHEFGHLLHHILGGQQRWLGLSGVATEHDFVEAPSQLFEEWAWDAKVLRRFALHVESGQPIPEDLVKRMRASDEFGKGVRVTQQMFYAALSLRYYDRAPDGASGPLDTTEVMKDLQKRYASFAYVPDTYFHASFGHLDGYSAMYYTYMWSLVIAKDLLSAFQAKGLMSTDVAHRYRDRILAPGGSKDAEDLIKDFLGRPYSFKAFEKWLSR